MVWRSNIRAASAKLVGPARVELLSRFAADWGARHARALADNDPMLVHEHGSVEHVLVVGEAPDERFVTIDLERRYTARTAVEPVVAEDDGEPELNSAALVG